MLLFLHWDYTHNRLTAHFLGLPDWAGTRKVKPIWILLKQETVSGSGISWAICSLHLAPDRLPCQHSTSQFFTGQTPFLPPNHQHQSTKGTGINVSYVSQLMMDWKHRISGELPSYSADSCWGWLGRTSLKWSSLCRVGLTFCSV